MNAISWLLGWLPRIPTPAPTPLPLPPPQPPVPVVPAPSPVPSPAADLKGVDISMWQGTPDWATVRQNIDFVIIKATEGTDYRDPRFIDAWSGATGLIRGAYHFARPDFGSSPEAEADWFCNNVAALLRPGDFVALDIETGSGNLLDWTLRWMRRVDAILGFRPLIYSYWSFLVNNGLHNSPELGQYGLWLADWFISAPPIVPGWAFVAIWQYSNRGAIPGIPARVDLDKFFGDKNQLRLYGKPTPATDPNTLPRIGG